MICCYLFCFVWVVWTWDYCCVLLCWLFGMFAVVLGATFCCWLLGFSWVCYCLGLLFILVADFLVFCFWLRVLLTRFILLLFTKAGWVCLLFDVFGLLCGGCLSLLFRCICLLVVCLLDVYTIATCWGVAQLMFVFGWFGYMCFFLRTFVICVVLRLVVLICLWIAVTCDFSCGLFFAVWLDVLVVFLLICVFGCHGCYLLWLFCDLWFTCFCLLIHACVSFLWIWCLGVWVVVCVSCLICAFGLFAFGCYRLTVGNCVCGVFLLLCVFVD